MHWQTSILLVVWVAALCSRSVVAVKMSASQTSDLVNKLNTLMHHSGWRCMDDVKISIKYRDKFINPVSVMLNGILSSNQKPVGVSNVLERHKEIWTVLMCKYGEIIFNYRDLVSNLIWVCQNEKTTSDSFQTYYHDCYRLLLIRLHGMSPRFKCMADALDYVYSLVPQRKSKFSVMVAAEKLTEYTLTLVPAKLSKHTTTTVVDLEMKTVAQYFSEVYRSSVYDFSYSHCNNTLINRTWTERTRTLIDDFSKAKTDQLVPPETTMLQYVVYEIDFYVDETFGKWFYDLGFAYDAEGKVTIRTNN